MKSPIVIHPFLFAIFPILFLFSHNIEQMSFSETLLPMAISLGFTSLLSLLFWLIFKNGKKSGLIISIFLIMFFSYGHIFNMIGDWQIGGFVIGKQGYLILLWIIISCSAYFTIKTQKKLHNLTNFLNIISIFLVVFSLYNIGTYILKVRITWEDDKVLEESRGIDTTGLEREIKLHDIYYIILDAYASESTLKEIYNYDNHGFIEYLTGKGFYIADESKTNYLLTFLSLSSSLNMEYVNYISDVSGIESRDRTMPYQMIKDNKVMNFLKSKGYKFIHFSSGWGPTNSNKYADLNIRCNRMNEFIGVLLQTTMLLCLDKYIIKPSRREKVLCTFSKLARSHKIKGPKFVFAHIICPHRPFIFGANGEPVPKTKLMLSGREWAQKENYINQLIFVNKKVKELINEILSKSRTSPIIILQADHGPLSIPLDSLTTDMLKERVRIFNAYYLPEGCNKLLYDSITPVNTFRVIFNCYFDTNYELLDDESYYSIYSNPYKFINVTDEIDFNLTSTLKLNKSR